MSKTEISTLNVVAQAIVKELEAQRIICKVEVEDATLVISNGNTTIDHDEFDKVSGIVKDLSSYVDSSAIAGPNGCFYIFKY